MHSNLKSNLTNYKDNLFRFKKYWLIYLIFITITTFTTISHKNIVHPKFELIAFILVAFLGVFCILYYCSHKGGEELFKVAFVIILIFGLMCSLVVPTVDVSDEVEHLTRAEITSQGVLIPHWTGEEMGVDRLYNHTGGEMSDEMNVGAGYATIESIKFFDKHREITVFETDHDTNKINQSTFIRGSAFEQNPFYGYLPQAIGILIAKLFDMNLIWLLWLARIGNLLFYSTMVSLAIKITPKFKIPLLAVACIPITIYQAASASIDSMIFALGILSIAYFIRIYFRSEISHKEILIFSALSLLLGLCKLPYLAFIFLLIFIPRDRFKEKKHYYCIFLSIFVIGNIGILYSRYSTPTLLHSWRSQMNYINSTAQLNYLIAHPVQISNFFIQIFTTDLGYIANGVFNFFNGTLGAHYTDNYVFITLILQMFLAAVLFLYPSKTNFETKTKIGALLVALVIYIGTCFIQLLTWAYVGQMGLGISVRYFIPLFALIPLIMPHWEYCSQDKFNDYAVMLIIGFMATLILSFATKYY